jgi:hypothetical protein
MTVEADRLKRQLAVLMHVRAAAGIAAGRRLLLPQRRQLAGWQLAGLQGLLVRRGQRLLQPHCRHVLLAGRSCLAAVTGRSGAKRSRGGRSCSCRCCRALAGAVWRLAGIIVMLALPGRSDALPLVCRVRYGDRERLSAAHVHVGVRGNGLRSDGMSHSARSAPAPQAAWRAWLRQVRRAHEHAKHRPAACRRAC